MQILDFVQGMHDISSAQDCYGDGQWHFIAAPYIWFAGLKGDVSVKGVADIPIDESFSDVFSNWVFG